jgi:hypothetical protein
MKTLLPLFLLFGLITLLSAAMISTYKGSPWENKAQTIPGKIQCELYDIGGEGIAYHDSDSVNNGSGRLNPANGNFYNEFRLNEGVDISYTKSNGIDDNPFSDVAPNLNEIYVGWTMPGEWIKYTVDVKESAVYKIGLMYTSNGKGGLEIVSESNISTGIMHVVSTHKDIDTVAWRQWHHWNKMDSIGSIRLEKGLQILTLKTIEEGNMNYDYLEFEPVK